MSGASPENPQMQRIRAHFEKKNKRFAQYSEQIQKKLAVLSHRLHEAETANHQKPLINDIGKNSELKKTELGRGPEEEGTSKFYVRLNDDSNVLNSSNVSGASGDRCRSRSDENTSSARLPDVSPKQSPAPNNVSLMRARSKYDTEELKKEVAELRLRHFASVEAVETVQAVVKNELQYFNNSFHEERVKHQHLEELLNDTIELNQAEIVGLKNELQSLTKRMEYHYNDKMTELRETIEALQNRVEKAETTLDEHFSRSHSRLGTGQALALSSANILVEVLKIVLFVSSVALDALKPLTGTRARAGVCVVIWTSIMVLLHWSGHLTSFFRHNATEAAALQN